MPYPAGCIAVELSIFRTSDLVLVGYAPIWLRVSLSEDRYKSKWMTFS